MLRKLILKIRRKLRENHVRSKSQVIFNNIQLNGDEPPGVALFCLVKNGTFFIERYIDHYRAMGVGAIYFIDNGSDDDLKSVVQNYPNICVIRCLAEFKLYENEMRRVPIMEYGLNSWCLCTDIDEFLMFPGLKDQKISKVVGYLKRYNYTCMVTQMIDMFSKVNDKNRERAATFQPEDYPYYCNTHIDQLEYHAVKYSDLVNENVAPSTIKFLFGGCRKRLFGTNNGLTKHSLMFVEKHSVPFLHPHCANGFQVADFTAALLHFHFADGFLDKTKYHVKHQDVGHGEHAAYLKVLEANPDLTFVDENSKHLGDGTGLIEDGILTYSQRYQSYLDRVNVPS